MNNNAFISAIEYHLPNQQLGNEELAVLSDRWTADKIHKKTGIAKRHVVGPAECASDLAVAAAENLFESGACAKNDIDFILLCTQSPDYMLPTTACLVQSRLGLKSSVGALDFNLGCSGFVYGLGLAKGLVETGQAQSVLLLTTETYSKYIYDEDLNVRTLFGDAAAATLVQTRPEEGFGQFVYGTDGRGAENLIVRNSGVRKTEDDGGSMRLYMNGPEIFAFTLDAVPTVVRQLLDKASLSVGDVDLFAFHQANQYMLKHLRDKLGIPVDRFAIAMEHCGNTVSSTIPIVLSESNSANQLKRGDLVMLVGFGVGYSWGASLLRW